MLALALIPLLGCKKVEPAPADLDSLLHWFWDKWEAGEEAELHDAAVNAFDVVDLEALVDDVQDGSLSRLSDDQTAAVGVSGLSALDAAGIYLVNVFDCELDELEPILWHSQQDVLYEGVYNSYQRTYTSSQADYASGAAAFLTWDFEYTASYLGSEYTAWPTGGLRHVPADDSLSPHGDIVLARTWMPTPAAFDGDGKSYDQDYQVEIYIAAGEGQLLHLYGMWRQAEYGAGFSTEDEGVQRLLLNNLAAWDETTEELCATGIPAAR